MTMHTNTPPPPAMPSPTTSPLPTPSLLPSPPTTPGKPGKVKKMVDSLKRRGSKILGRRASSSSASGFPLASPRSPRSSPSHSRPRSRSPSPTGGRPVHQRARTTSLVFTSLRLPRKALQRASSARSLRSEDTAVSSTHTRSPSTATSFSYTKDKLSLDVDDAALSPRLPLATIVSAVEEADPADRFAVPEPAEIIIPEAEEETAPAAVEEPEAVVIQPVIIEEPEPEPVMAAPEPEPVVTAPEPAPVVVVSEPEPVVAAPEPKPVVVISEPAPAPEPQSEPTVLAPSPKPEPTVLAPSPAPLTFVPS